MYSGEITGRCVIDYMFAFIRAVFVALISEKTRHSHIIILTGWNLIDSKVCQKLKNFICHVLKPFYRKNQNISVIFPGRFSSAAIRQWPLTTVSPKGVFI